MIRRLWFIILLIGWAFLIWQFFFDRLLPISWWVTDASITVDDGTYGGKSPTVEVNINYQKKILVHWNRLLTRLADNWVPLACNLEGEGEVEPGVQHTKMDLKQLFNDMSCSSSLLPGQYIVELDYEWFDGPQRSITVESNIFTIYPRPPSIRQPPPSPDIQQLEVRPAKQYRKHTNNSNIFDFLGKIFQHK